MAPAALPSMLAALVHAMLCRFAVKNAHAFRHALQSTSPASRTGRLRRLARGRHRLGLELPSAHARRVLARAQNSRRARRAAAVAAVRGRARRRPRAARRRAHRPSALGRRWASTSGARSASTREERGAFGPLYELYQLQTAHAVASTACGVLFLVSGYEIDFAALAVARRGGRRRPRRPRRQSAATSASTASLAQIIFEI